MQSIHGALHRGERGLVAQETREAATSLFQALDTQGTGRLTQDQFVAACLKVRRLCCFSP